MELNPSSLQMVIVAVRSEIRRLQAEISGSSEDVPELEECLVQWEQLQAELKAGYARARAADPNLRSYESIVGDIKFRLEKGGRHPDERKP